MAAQETPPMSIVTEARAELSEMRSAMKKAKRNSENFEHEQSDNVVVGYLVSSQ